MQKQGYGKILVTLQAAKDGYNLLTEAKELLNANSSEERNNKLEDICKKLENIDYSDKSIEDKYVSQSMSAMKKAKDELVDKIYETIGRPNPNPEHKEEGFFDKIKNFLVGNVQCPVDFTIYDENGNVLGYVDNGEVKYNDSIYIEKSGDVKKFYVPIDMKINIEFKGTGEGELTYVIEEKTNSEDAVGRLNYYSIPLEKGIGYTQVIDGTSLSEKTFTLKSDSGDIAADEYISVNDENAVITIDAVSDDNGEVIGGGKYPKGEPIELTAIPNDHTTDFIGWYINGEIVSVDLTYRFPALENVQVYAKFEKISQKDKNYSSELDKNCTDFYKINVYKDDKGADKIALNAANLEDTSDKELTINKYSLTGELINTENVKAIFDGKVDYVIDAVVLTDCAKAELLNSNDEVIAVIKDNTAGEDMYITNLNNNTSIIGEYVDSIIEINNKSDTYKQIWCTMAVYNQDGRMVGISSKQVDMNSDGSVKTKLNVESTDEKLDENIQVKVFVWDNLSSMRPIISAQSTK